MDSQKNLLPTYRIYCKKKKKTLKYTSGEERQTGCSQSPTGVGWWWNYTLASNPLQKKLCQKISTTLLTNNASLTKADGSSFVSCDAMWSYPMQKEVRFNSIHGNDEKEGEEWKEKEKGWLIQVIACVGWVMASTGFTSILFKFKKCCIVSAWIKSGNWY